MQAPILTPASAAAAPPGPGYKAGADAGVPTQDFHALLTQEKSARSQAPAPMTPPDAPDRTADGSGAEAASAAAGARTDETRPRASADAPDAAPAAAAATVTGKDKPADTDADLDRLPAPLAAFVNSLLQMQASMKATDAAGKKAACLDDKDAAPGPDPAMIPVAPGTVPPLAADAGQREPDVLATVARDPATGKGDRDAAAAAGMRAATLQAPAAAAAARPDRDADTAFDAALQAATIPAAPAAAATTPAAAGPLPQASLAPPVGTAAWDQALAQRVSWMVSGAQHSATLILNPPELGPLQVVLNLSKTHADASFIAPQPEVRQALEAALPKLRDMLGEAGISLGQASVGSGSADAQAEFGAPARHGGRPAFHGDGHAAIPAASGMGQTASGRGLIDTFA